MPEFQFDVHGAAAPVYHKSCSSNCLDSPGAFRMGLDWIGLEWIGLDEVGLSVFLHGRWDLGVASGGECLLRPPKSEGTKLVPHFGGTSALLCCCISCIAHRP